MSNSTWTTDERRLGRKAWRAAREYENRYGEFKSYIDCEQVVADAVEQDADFRLLDNGEVFWELVGFVTSSYYGGDDLDWS